MIRGLHSGGAGDVVYFEKQGNDRLCGLHCINNALQVRRVPNQRTALFFLFQGPYVTVDECQRTGQVLNARESALNAREENYSNASSDGFFSVHVIEAVLSQRSYVFTPFASQQMSELRSDPAKHSDTFVCNLREHWFVIRPVLKRWFLLDSLRPAPEAISEQLLLYDYGCSVLLVFNIVIRCRSFIDSLRQTNYTVFVVRHRTWPRVKLPEPSPKKHPSIKIVSSSNGPIQGNVFLTFSAAASLSDGLGSSIAGASGQKDAAVKRKEVGHQWPTMPGRTCGGTSSEFARASVNEENDPDLARILKESAREYTKVRFLHFMDMYTCVSVDFGKAPGGAD